MALLLLLLLLPPGIEHRSWEGRWNGQGPFSVQILEVDPRHPAIDIVPVHARDGATGRETVLALAQRYGAAAAVNGGYFLYKPYDGAAAGNLMINGQVLGTGSSRSALVFCEEQDDVERLTIARAAFVGRVRSPRFDIALAGVNRPHAGQGLILFTSALGGSTLTAGSTEARLSPEGRVLEIVSGGNAAIPPGGSVLSAAPGGRLPPLQQGDLLQLDLRFLQSACRARDLLGAGPALLRGGRIAIDEDGFAHAPARHPRTAVAVKQNGNLLFVTVDGRQPRSIGMTIAELAQFLLEQGAMDALNLDGGGSTTMVAGGAILNRPSDAFGPRPVSDAILIFSTSTPAELNALRQRLSATPGAARIVEEAARASAKSAK
jgi:hypothetical protein